MYIKKLSFYILLSSIVFSSCKTKRQKLFLLIDNVDGVHVGTSILSRGLMVGQIANFTLVDSAVLVELNIFESYKIPKESKFEIVLDKNNPGENLINIVYASHKNFYRDNDTIVIKVQNKLVSETKQINLDSSHKKRVVEFFEAIDTAIKIIKK